MASDVDICNIALANIGIGSIQALTEGSQSARLCKVKYPQCRNELLRARAWSFAKKTVLLTVDADDAAPGWLYRYSLPPDCKKALMVTTDGQARGTNGEKYTLQSNQAGSAMTLLTDATPAYLEYSYENTNAPMYDDLFVGALAYRLAMDLSVLLTDNANSMRETMRQEFRIALSAAKATDLNESNDNEEPEPGAIEARNS